MCPLIKLAMLLDLLVAKKGSRYRSLGHARTPSKSPTDVLLERLATFSKANEKLTEQTNIS